MNIQPLSARNERNRRAVKTPEFCGKTANSLNFLANSKTGTYTPPLAYPQDMAPARRAQDSYPP